MKLVTATLPSGSVYPAIQFADGILLTHPQLSLDKLDNDYEKAVVAALDDKSKRAGVVSAAGSDSQHFLPIGDNWSAPMSVHKGTKGEVIALLHYGPG